MKKLLSLLMLLCMLCTGVWADAVQTSTIESPIEYYIGNVGNWLVNDNRYAHNSKSNSENTENHVGRFIFIDKGDGTVYIYNTNVNKYITWTTDAQSTSGDRNLASSKVQYADTRDAAKSWYITQDGSNNQYLIKPTSSSGNSWNFAGGAVLSSSGNGNFPLNLYGTSDASSKWKFYIAPNNNICRIINKHTTGDRYLGPKRYTNASKNYSGSFRIEKGPNGGYLIYNYEQDKYLKFTATVNADGSHRGENTAYVQYTENKAEENTEWLIMGNAANSNTREYDIRPYGSSTSASFASNGPAWNTTGGNTYILNFWSADDNSSKWTIVEMEEAEKAGFVLQAGKIYTIRTKFSDKETSHYLNLNGSNLAAATTLGSGKWIYTSEGYLQNVADNTKYLAIVSGPNLGISTTAAKMRLSAGGQSGTARFTTDTHSFAVKKDGTIDGGRYSDMTINNINDWTTDFVFESTGEMAYKVVIVGGGNNASVTYDNHAVANNGFIIVDGEHEFAASDFTAPAQTVISDFAVENQTITITLAKDWEAYKALYDRLDAFTIGTGLGEYANITKYSGEYDTELPLIGWKSTFALDLKLKEESRYDSNMEAMQWFIEHMTLNMPQPGMFLRIKASRTNKTTGYSLTEDQNLYLTSEISTQNTGRAAFALTNGSSNATNTIFYYDENKNLIAYDKGVRAVNNSNFLQIGEVGAEGTIVTFEEIGRSIEAGAYRIEFNNGGRSLYTQKNNSNYFTDAAGGNSTGEHYRYFLEEVKTLPLTVGETKFATFYTPVNVAVPIAITPYVCHLDGENLAMYTCKQTTTVGSSEFVVIPAHTAVMINAKYVQTYSLPIVEDESIEEYTNNSFFGDVATKPFATDYTYYSLQKDSQNASQVGFFIKPSGNFKGFQAFLKTEITAPVQRFNVSFDDNALVTDITNVLGTENITIPAYDLSGRKVDANSHRGLYIMNGKKVIR